MISEGSFEMVLVVIGKDVLPGAEQPLHLRVVLGDKLNDKETADFTEKERNITEREIVGNCQMVYEGKDKNYFHWSTFCKRGSLFICPPDGRAGVRQVNQQDKCPGVGPS